MLLRLPACTIVALAAALAAHVGVAPAAMGAGGVRAPRSPAAAGQQLVILSTSDVMGKVSPCG
jgi:hypothetical protein